MTISDYRNYAGDVISEIYQTFSIFRTKQGEDLFFNLIFQLLTPEHNMDQQQYHTQIDVAFFIIKSILQVIIINTESNPYINRIIKFILSDELPNNPVLVSGSIYILSEGQYEIKVSSEQLLAPTLLYLLNLTQNTDMNRLAATTLKEIIEVMDNINSVDTFKVFICFLIYPYLNIFTQKVLIDHFANNFWVQNDDIVLDCLVQSVFQYSVKITDQQMQKEALEGLLYLVEDKLKYLIENTNNSQNFNKIINLLISLVRGFSEMTQNKSGKIVTQLCANFVGNNMEFLNKMFGEYGSINQEIMEKFLKLFKLIITVCDDKLPQSFIHFLETSLKIFQIDPIKNAQSLSIFSTLLECLGAENEIFLQWLNNNYNDFNNYMLVIFENQNNNDPDLIRQYVQILNRTIQYNFQIFLHGQQFESILKFIMQSFLTINEFEMTKAIYRFLASFIKYSQANQKVQQFVPMIINYLLIKMPDVNKSLIHNCSLIFTYILQVFKDVQQIGQIILQSLKDQKFEVLSNKQQEIFTESIMIYASENNLKELRSIFGDFSSLINGTITNNDMFFQLEVKIMGQKRARKNGIQLQSNH